LSPIVSSSVWTVTGHINLLPRETVKALPTTSSVKSVSTIVEAQGEPKMHHSPVLVTTSIADTALAGKFTGNITFPKTPGEECFANEKETSSLTRESFAKHVALGDKNPAAVEFAYASRPTAACRAAAEAAAVVAAAADGAAVMNSSCRENARESDNMLRTQLQVRSSALTNSRTDVIAPTVALTDRSAGGVHDAAASPSCSSARRRINTAAVNGTLFPPTMNSEADDVGVPVQNCARLELKTFETYVTSGHFDVTSALVDELSLARDDLEIKHSSPSSNRKAPVTSTDANMRCRPNSTASHLRRLPCSSFSPLLNVARSTGFNICKSADDTQALLKSPSM